VRSATSWLRAIRSTVVATSAMQIAPTIVIAASFTEIERFENSLSIVHPGRHGAQQIGASLDVRRTAN
jgi:hypothetical protein